VTVFEANAWPGGHVHTHEIAIGGRSWPVDTGFIVYNERAYPNFVRMLATLGVATRPTSMSFAVRCDRTGLEYGGTGPGALFAQRRNLLRPWFWRMLRDVLRFGREARELLVPGDESLGLRAYLGARGYSPAFVEHYAIPMGAAIWSAPPAAMADFPARQFVRFFDHHGVLDIRRAPGWRTIVGGSGSYVERLIAPFRERIRLSTKVRRVTPTADGVEVTTAVGETARFDRAVIAAHSDQALAMLDPPTARERQVLGAIRYQTNDAVLHTDARVMPRRRRAWSSWNYLIPGPGDAGGAEAPSGAAPGLPSPPSGQAAVRADQPAGGAAARVLVTYYMNLLQGLESPLPLLVTLNGANRIDPAKIVRRMSYEHPVYDAAAFAAQRRFGEIDGVRRVHFCGAYWGYGFHEDGVDSALAVTRGVFGMGLEALA
jgi:predicted NAD/FAD-binding protein